MQKVTRLKCDNCEKGIVKLIVKAKRGGLIDVSIKKCDVCKKQFGVNTIQKLEIINELTNEESNFLGGGRSGIETAFGDSKSSEFDKSTSEIKP